MKKSEFTFFTYSKHELRTISKATPKIAFDFSPLYEEPLYQKADTILAYMALPYEVNIDYLLKTILLDNKKLYLPKISLSLLAFLHVTDLATELIKGKYNIMEPISSLRPWQWKKEQSILLLAPALASSKDGYRLGHGFGYYDKFLAMYADKPNITSVIINDSKFDQLDFPYETHDIPFDYVLTNDGLRQCRR